MLRRARLEYRFRCSAQPVTLEEFFYLIWPEATKEDRVLMDRWAELRKARHILTFREFKGTDPEEMKAIFELLSSRKPGQEGKLYASEIIRAHVLPEPSVLEFTKGENPSRFCFDFEEFKSVVWPELKQKWVTRDTIRKMKQEEEFHAEKSFEVGLAGLRGNQAK